jgi:hypothetical protein
LIKQQRLNNVSRTDPGMQAGLKSQFGTEGPRLERRKHHGIVHYWHKFKAHVLGMKKPASPGNGASAPPPISSSDQKEPGAATDETGHEENTAGPSYDGSPSNYGENHSGSGYENQGGSGGYGGNGVGQGSNYGERPYLKRRGELDERDYDDMDE